jgi:hypothetical protein
MDPGSELAFYRWRTKFDEMDVSEAKRLKKMVAEQADTRSMSVIRTLHL